MTSPRKRALEKARRESIAIVDAVKPILIGRDPAVIGWALSELTALLIAGHPAAAREEILNLHISTVRELIPIAVAHFGTDIPNEDTP